MQVVKLLLHKSSDVSLQVNVQKQNLLYLDKPLPSVMSPYSYLLVRLRAASQALIRCIDGVLLLRTIAHALCNANKSW